MTRQYAPRARRKTAPFSIPRVPRRDPSIRTLGFTCYRLEHIADPEPGEGDFAPIELTSTSSAMGVFAR